MKMDSASMQPMGLSSTSNGMVLNLHSPNAAQTNASIEFSIVDASKRPVTDYTVEQTQKLHLILVRRDYTNYQHLHPTLRPDGTWSVHASFAEPGTYRLIADFTPTGKARTVLATNLAVGDQTTTTPTSLPATSNTTTIDGFTVTLASTDLAVGTENSLDETVTRNGKPVQLEQYLGSYGHAVLVRVPDFAYLHVHPASTDPVNGKVTFAATPTTASKYVAFIQFQVAGKVHTAQFTLNAAGHGSSTPTSTPMTGMGN